jgi:hypothetical protein
MRHSAIGHKPTFMQTDIGRECTSFVRIIASIEDPMVIQKILAHLDEKAVSAATRMMPQWRAPPPTGLSV